MLKLENLDVFYGRVQALFGLSLTVKPGEIVTLIGSNGAGKSTTLRTISGLLKPRSGSITFDGTDLAAHASHDIVALGISHVPEGRRIFTGLSVAENLDMGAYLVRDKQEAAARRERVFALFPRLKERMDQPGGTLSGGEQQMLAIGRALMTNPRLLVLDEATEGLAPLVRAQIWTCLGEIKEAGMSILIVDKNIADLVRIADRHIVIEKGRVVWSGTSTELRAAEDVQHCYLGV
jgi:branched-chain amino acid transport system ATP-binding protein